MPEHVSLSLTPGLAADPQAIQQALARKLGRPVDSDRTTIVRRSIDARKPVIRIHLELLVLNDDEDLEGLRHRFNYTDVHSAEAVPIVGAGPAGLFAALRLIELGLKPVVVERGKPVEVRRRDVAALNRRGVLDSESNYAFGEGGAGTFSDGKLYTRSKKRGDHRRVLHRLHQHGADDRILYEAYPHIGSDRLPGIVSAMRATVEAHGGIFRFGHKVTRLVVEHGCIEGVELDTGERVDGRAVILATGHSARDVYRMLLDQAVFIEAKPFAVGVRVEHPQALIDRIQYHGRSRGKTLPAAAYRLTRQVKGRGVYSFCMCPGGIIVPASTQDDALVVNGMSFSKRNSGYANAGIVVEVRLTDIPGLASGDVMAALDYQLAIERQAYRHGGGGMVAPAQRLVDFVDEQPSSRLPTCSYPPGVVASCLHEWLPEAIRTRLQTAFKAFDQQMNGFLTNEAIVVGVESRTSSPVRIPRDPQTLEHIDMRGLFPCGEGAGYAGGIVSSAVDGERVAEAVFRNLER